MISIARLTRNSNNKAGARPDEGTDGDGWLDGGGARRDKNPIRAAVLWRMYYIIS